MINLNTQTFHLLFSPLSLDRINRKEKKNKVLNAYNDQRRNNVRDSGIHYAVSEVLTTEQGVVLEVAQGVEESSGEMGLHRSLKGC